MLRFPCFVFHPLSAPHPVVLSPQSLYPSDSRQCVLHPPTWHSAQGPQGVCVYVFHCVAFLCTLCTGVAPHMLVFNYLFFFCLWFKMTCLCLLSVCLFLRVCLSSGFAFGTLVALFWTFWTRIVISCASEQTEHHTLWERESEWVSERVSKHERERKWKRVEFSGVTAEQCLPQMLGNLLKCFVKSAASE